MLNRKMIKWVAATVLAGAPAIGLARTHHVTTAVSPLSASAVLTSTPSAPTKLVSTHKRSVKHHRAVKHTRRNAKSHVRKTSSKGRHHSRAKLKKA